MAPAHRNPEQRLADLARGIRQCERCPLYEHRSQAVPGEGLSQADLMLVGEGPGAEEDRTGKPFVGRAGSVLDDALDEAGIDRATLFVTSTVKCRPPGNRNPREVEWRTCRDAWLQQQIAVVQPQLLVLLGRVAALALLDDRRRLRDMRGTIHHRNGRRFLVTYHPAGAMRSHDRWRDFLADLRWSRELVETS